MSSNPDNETRKPSFAERMAQLRQDYWQRLPCELDALVQLAEQWRLLRPARETPTVLHRQLHNLVGSSGAFGFTCLSAQARLLEQQVKAWCEPLPPIDEAQVDKFCVELAALRDFLQLEPAATSGEQAPTAPGGEVWVIARPSPEAEALLRQLRSYGFALRQFGCLADVAERCQTSATHQPGLVLFANPAEFELADTPLHLSSLGCPWLALGGSGEFNHRTQCVRLGAQGYFTPPPDVPALARRITQIFEAQAAPLRRVLIVEDETLLATHYRLMLLNAGMEAIILHAPDQLLPTLASFRPELVLMDLYLRDHLGTELAGVIRQHEHWANLPIVYLSSETNLDLQAMALSGGADDFLTKNIAEAQLLALIRARVDRARQLASLISRDGLTGLLKHSNIKEALNTEILRTKRSNAPLAVAMIDIDHFKRVNDTHGHAQGDRVIAALATLLKQRLRQTDKVGRYGGEEFVAVLSECDPENAQRLLDDIRASFANIVFRCESGEFRCELSAGIACFMWDKTLESVEGVQNQLLKLADEALYSAKHQGRNRVVMAG